MSRKVDLDQIFESSQTVQEVLGMQSKEDKITYLVKLKNQATQLMTSDEAKEVCPYEVIKFYTMKCEWTNGFIRLPAKYMIGNEQMDPY